MRQRTMMLNTVRAHLAEFGIIAAQGPHKLLSLMRAIEAGDGPSLPSMAHVALDSLTSQLDTLTDEIRKLERQLLAWHRADETSRWLETIPGIGIITATVLAASVPDSAVFRNGREFAAFLGLVPRQASSAGKERLGRISKTGDGYPRWLLVVGATAVVRRASRNPSATGAWCAACLSASRPGWLQSRKTTRIAWAILAR